jgi:hypothetical protein
MQMSAAWRRSDPDLDEMLADLSQEPRLAHMLSLRDG